MILTTRIMAKQKPIYGRKSDGTPITTQREAVLDFLMKGGRLTQEEARAMWSTTRLPSLINVLRNQLAAQGGKFRIITKNVQGKNRFGAPCKYGEYHIEQVED